MKPFFTNGGGTPPVPFSSLLIRGEVSICTYHSSATGRDDMLFWRIFMFKRHD